MAKLNKELKAKLVFEIKERQHDQEPTWKQMIISTSYEGIYRQYSFGFDSNDHHEEDDDMTKLIDEAKNILTFTIERELNKVAK